MSAIPWPVKIVRFDAPLLQRKEKIARPNKNAKKAEKKRIRANQKKKNQEKAEDKRVEAEFKAENGDKPAGTSSGAEKSHDSYQVYDFNCS
jgi:hypothetical protein